MRIAVDVMGGDHGCGVVISGVKQALQSIPQIERLFLVGRSETIQQSLEQHHCSDRRLQVVQASEVLTMEDKPVIGLRKKRDCSIARAVDLVKHGKAQALISLGNTGGLVAASTIKLRPLPGVDRPAIATVIPTPYNEFVLLDAGANIECKPLHLLHYALMGSVYSQKILGYDQPRVGLLNVGTEAVKGNELTQEAYKLCQQTNLNFIGNVEGHDLFENQVEVVVCNGFVGNIVLKTCESLATNLFAWMKRELTQTRTRQFGAWLARSAFRTIKHRMDPEVYGGAPLLGLNGNVIKAHGSAREFAICNAIRVAAEAVDHNINQLISQQVMAANETLTAMRTVETASAST